jgi:SAM-dependent methyltransferase
VDEERSITNLERGIDAIPLICTALTHRDASDSSQRCGRLLEVRDAHTLVCVDADCRAEYRVAGGFPTLIAHDVPAPLSHYNDELLAEAYVEMNFASFVVGPELDGLPRIGAGPVEEAVQSLRQIRDLTGPFYVDVVRHLMAESPNRDGLLVDVGCGMGRIGLELDKAGWTGSYLGLDLSARLIEEAVRVFHDGADDVRMPALVGDVPRTEVLPIDPQRLDPARSILAVADANYIPVQQADVVMALNLVDRVEDPAALVEHLWDKVAEGGLLVLSDPFHWESGTSRKDRFVSFRALDALIGTKPVSNHPVTFAMRRRDHRKTVIYDDQLCIWRKDSSG